MLPQANPQVVDTIAKMEFDNETIDYQDYTNDSFAVNECHYMTDMALYEAVSWWLEFVGVMVIGEKYLDNVKDSHS